ncbi:hypothetical protein [Jatrophihabitans fulvus]
MSDTQNPSRRHRASKAKHGASRVRFAPLAIATGVAASAAIALSTSGALAGFVAQITNDTNTAATGSLSMQEQQIVNGTATTTCTSNGGTGGVSNNVAVCSTINKYGGSTAMIPGTPVSTTVKITNTGTVAANTFTIAPGTCTQSNNGAANGNATDLCSKMTVALTQDGTAVAGASGTLTSIGGKTVTLAPVAAGASSTFVFTVTLPTQNTAQAPTADNAYQGLKASQPLVWQFSS